MKITCYKMSLKMMMSEKTGDKASTSQVEGGEVANERKALIFSVKIAPLIKIPQENKMRISYRICKLEVNTYPINENSYAKLCKAALGTYFGLG